MATRPHARFRCPACGFTVFNRRLATCESCAAELPESIRLSPREQGLMDADHARNEQARADLAREATAQERARERRSEGGGDFGLGDVLDGLADGD